MSLAETSPLHLFLLFFAVATMGSIWWSLRSDSLWAGIIARWLRWLFIATLGGLGLTWSGWFHYPVEVLIVVVFLLWFVIETGYNWIAINAISQSGLPIFPKFQASDRKDFWPKEMKFILLRDWLRTQQFRRKQYLIGSLDEHTMVRLLVYEQELTHIRFHLLLLPALRPTSAACFSFNSQDASGRRCITDNISLPYGGFYPEEWLLERLPRWRSVEALYQRHLERLDALEIKEVPFSRDPVDTLNNDRLTLERLNRELGFFAADEIAEEEGRITAAGRYRIWKEIWTLGYLGRAHSY